MVTGFRGLNCDSSKNIAGYPPYLLVINLSSLCLSTYAYLSGSWGSHQYSLHIRQAVTLGYTLLSGFGSLLTGFINYDPQRCRD